MQSQILSAQQIRNISTSKLPNGEYMGVWGGYEVRAEINGKQYLFKTENGIRTNDAPCKVCIQDGKVTIETL